MSTGLDMELTFPLQVVVAYIIVTTNQLAVQITKLGVHSAFRRKGLAKALLQVLLAFLPASTALSIPVPQCCMHVVCMNGCHTTVFCIQAAINAAKQERRSIQCATLHVDCSNIAAIELYKSFGFQQDSYLKNYYSEGSHAYLLIYNTPS